MIEVDLKAMTADELVDYIEIYSECFHPAVIKALKELKELNGELNLELDGTKHQVVNAYENIDALEYENEELKGKLATIQEVLNE